MKRNNLYIVIGVLAAAVIVLGYYYYEDQQKQGIEININEDGISVEEK